MKITEITQQLDELSFADRMKDFVAPGRNIDPETYEKFLPPDRARGYYKNEEFYFRRSRLKWYSEKTGKPANMFAQAELMDEYGFDSLGRPTRELQRKIVFDDRAREVFDDDSVAKIDKAFAAAKREFLNTHTLASYFKNAAKLHGYYDKDFNLQDLDSRIDKTNFDIGTPPRVSTDDVQTLADLYQHTFKLTSKKQFDQVKADYDARTATTPRPTATAYRSLPAASDAKVKDIITKSIANLDVAGVAKIPPEIDKLKQDGYVVTDYQNIVAVEIRKVVDAAAGLTDPKKMDAMLDILINLKAMFPFTAATRSKINALNLDTMFSGLPPADLTNLKNKKTLFLRP